MRRENSLDVLIYSRERLASRQFPPCLSAIPALSRSNSRALTTKLDSKKGGLGLPFSCVRFHAHFTVTVIFSEITGGSSGTWFLSPTSSCRVCLPGGRVTSVSVWPLPKCLRLSVIGSGMFIAGS